MLTVRIDEREIQETFKTVDSEHTGMRLPNHTIIELADGFFGLPELKRLELTYEEDQLPFMRLLDVENDDLGFVVANPYDLLDDYRMKVGDVDAERLGIDSVDDVVVLVIVTICRKGPQKVYANLVGPLVVNVRTKQARQVVLSNYLDYTTHHLIYSE